MYLITPDRFANADPSNDNLDDVKIDRSRGELAMEVIYVVLLINWIISVI